MALLLPILSDHQHLVSSLLGGDDHLSLKLSDEDFLSPLLPKKIRRQIISSPYTRHLSHFNKERTIVPAQKNHFQVNVDVQQFSPEDITVKVVGDDTVVVECKHEEKQDEHGFISRHFVRKYKVPKGHDVSKCNSKLSSDGVLTITIPKVEKSKKTEVDIPIVFTNQPSQIAPATEKVSVEEKGKKSGGKK